MTRMRLLVLVMATTFHSTFALANECELKEEALDVRFLKILPKDPEKLHPEIQEIAHALEQQGIVFQLVQNDNGMVALEIVGSSHSRINALWQGIGKNNANLRFLFYPDSAYKGRGYYHSEGHFIRLTGEYLKLLSYDPLAFDTMIHEIYHGKLAMQKRKGLYSAYHPHLKVKEGHTAPYAEGQENYRNFLVFEEFFTWRQGAKFHYNQALSLAKVHNLYAFSQSIKHFEMRMAGLLSFHEYFANIWPLIKSLKPSLKEIHGEKVAIYHYKKEAYDFTLEVPLLKYKDRENSPEQLLNITATQIQNDLQAIRYLQNVYDNLKKETSLETKALIIQNL